MTEGGDIIAFRPNRNSPEAVRERSRVDAVERLRKYADLAEKGEVVGVVIAVVYADGRIGTAYTPSDDTARQLAAVTLAQHEYTRHIVEDLEEH